MTTPDVSALIAELRSTTEEMAHRAAVDMDLWNRHSNAALATADALTALQARTERAEAGMANIISAHDEWTAAMQGLDFDDPLSDAIEAARTLVPAASTAAARVIRDAVEETEAEDAVDRFVYPTAGFMKASDKLADARQSRRQSVVDYLKATKQERADDE